MRSVIVFNLIQRTAVEGKVVLGEIINTITMYVLDMRRLRGRSYIT